MAARFSSQFLAEAGVSTDAGTAAGVCARTSATPSERNAHALTAVTYDAVDIVSPPGCEVVGRILH